MAFEVFLSHSVSPRELGIVYGIANQGAKKGASPFIPDRDWDPKRTIPKRISVRLKNTDYLLAIATSSGFQLEWLNREVVEVAGKKPFLIVADKGMKLPPNVPSVLIDRSNPAKTIGEVAMRLEKFGKDKKTKELLTWFGIGGLFFLLLLGVKK